MIGGQLKSKLNMKIFIIFIPLDPSSELLI